jgi:hypothetical protein
MTEVANMALIGLPSGLPLAGHSPVVDPDGSYRCQCGVPGGPVFGTEIYMWFAMHCLGILGAGQQSALTLDLQQIEGAPVVELIADNVDVI